LMVIMLMFIIGSRYSSKLYRLTFNRALPVLATLLMLTYTSMLQVIATIFFYAKVVTVPGNAVTYVTGFWKISPNVTFLQFKYL